MLFCSTKRYRTETSVASVVHRLSHDQHRPCQSIAVVVDVPLPQFYLLLPRPQRTFFAVQCDRMRCKGIVFLLGVELKD